MTLRFGILGAADIAPKALIEPATDLPGVDVLAVAARDVSRAAAFATLHSVPRVHRTYEEVINDPDVDAVYNSLPASHHRRWSIAALKAGKHVLCEKPFAANAEEAAEMVAAAAGSNRVLCEALHWRYHPIADRILSLIAEIGRLRRIEAVFEAPIRDPADIRYNLALAGGALMDLGCYPVHWVRTVAASEPTVVKAVAVQGPPAIDVSMEAELELQDGATASVRTSMSTDRSFRATLMVEGTRGSIEVDNPLAPHLWNKISVRMYDGAPVTECVEGSTTYHHQLEAFARAVSDGDPLPTGGADAIASMRVIDLIYEAAGLPRRQGI